MSGFKYNQRKINNKLKNLRSIALILVITSIIPTFFLYIFLKEAPGFSTLLATCFKYDRSIFFPWINQIFFDIYPPMFHWIFIFLLNFIDLIIMCNLICFLETMIYLYVSQTIIDEEEIDESLYLTLQLSRYDITCCKDSDRYSYSINGLDKVGYHIRNEKFNLNSFYHNTEPSKDLIEDIFSLLIENHWKIKFFLFKTPTIIGFLYIQERHIHYKKLENFLLFFNFGVAIFSMKKKNQKLISKVKSTHFRKMSIQFIYNILLKTMN